MSQNIRILTRILFGLALTAIVLVMLCILINVFLQPPVATAQEPPDGKLPPVLIDEETLATFGLSAEDIQATEVLSYDLEIVKTTSIVSVTTGSPVTFSVVITNRGPDTIPAFFFKDTFPPEMQNVHFLFSAPAISNHDTIPLWFVNQTLPAGSKVNVTVTGILSSTYSKMVTNKAEVIPFAINEITSTNNSSAVNVNIIGNSSLTIIFLPLINKAPPRVLVYYDSFSSSSSGWTTADDSDCNRSYKDNEYQMVADANEACFTPAPTGAEVTNGYGEFQVSARVSDGDGNFDYGIYINGAGGDNYYLFRVKPDDDCGWKLVRRKSGTSTTIGSGGCVSAINRGTAKNTLTIKHDKNGAITLYINGTQIFSINDGNALTSKGTGLFVEADDNEDITVRFDDFRVYTVP
ncbi:MAG: hypothetical protein JXM69_19370 [Anaerolineae bacterium]|nr:hypothetical protein [Anaerolineae bacterium]